PRLIYHRDGIGAESWISAPAAVEETFDRGKQNFIRQQPDHNDHQHDANDLVHGTQFAAIMKQLSKSKSRQNSHENSRGHEGTPGERPALFHSTNNKGEGCG